MAAIFQSGSVYISDASAVAVAKACKVAYIIFTANSPADYIVLYDSASSAAAGSTKLVIKGGVAAQTNVHDFSSKPITFSNGIWAALSTPATATLILTSEGSST